MLGKWSRKLGPSRLIALSFVILILTGTFLLCLPVSARDGNFTSPLDALFTATSATWDLLLQIRLPNGPCSGRLSFSS